MGNSTTILGNQLSTPVATDPNLCRISGYLRDVHGTPLRGFGITIRHIYKPIAVASSTLILNERRTFRTDKDGFVQFDIWRTACVDVELPNRLLDHVLHLKVPDSASSDIVDFLFPYVVSVEFVTASPANIAVGATTTLQLQAVLSNGNVAALDSGSTVLESSNDGVAVKTSAFTFQGVSVGSALVTVDTFDPAALNLLKQPDGTPVVMFNQPAVALPAGLTINVS